MENANVFGKIVTYGKKRYESRYKTNPDGTVTATMYRIEPDIRMIRKRKYPNYESYKRYTTSRFELHIETSILEQRSKENEE